MSTCPPLPSSLLLTSSSRPFCLTEDSPITGKWQTNYRGRTFHLDAEGRLRPAQRIGAAMSTAHLDQMRENRHRDAARAVHDELLQLAVRREAHRRTQEDR